MITYRGRELPCFMVRKGCKKMAEFRVEGQYVVMHVCGDHRVEAEGISPPAKTTELAPQPGGVDKLNASSCDNAELNTLPHIISADDVVVDEMADRSIGDIQCPYVKRNGDDGVLCCVWKKGHTVPHQDVYNNQRGPWSLTGMSE